MLPDGSNRTYHEPQPPIRWRKKGDLRNVIVYGLAISPQVMKIICYLVYYDIPYTWHQQPHKNGSDYKNTPVLDASGRQVNGGCMIMKSIIPPLVGNFNTEWEQRIIFEFEISFETEMMENDYGQLASLVAPLSCMARYLGRKLQKIRKADSEHKQKVIRGCRIISCADFLDSFIAKVGSKKFFSGERPGQVDISLYGTMCPMYYLGAPTAMKLINRDKKLLRWWERMKTEIPRSKLYPSLDAKQRPVSTNCLLLIAANIVLVIVMFVAFFTAPDTIDGL